MQCSCGSNQFLKRVDYSSCKACGRVLKVDTLRIKRAEHGVFHPGVVEYRSRNWRYPWIMKDGSKYSTEQIKELQSDVR